MGSNKLIIQFWFTYINLPFYHPFFHQFLHQIYLQTYQIHQIDRQYSLPRPCISRFRSRFRPGDRSRVPTGDAKYRVSLSRHTKYRVPTGYTKLSYDFNTPSSPRSALQFLGRRNGGNQFVRTSI